MRGILVRTFVLAAALAAALCCAQAAGAEDVRWQRTYDGRLHGGDAFTAAVATPGGLYAAGYSAVSSKNRSDMLLVRYAADGATVWARQWNGPASGSDQCWDLARDRRGGLLLAGRTAGRGGDAAVVRYSSGGRLLWARRFDTGAGRQDDARFVRSLRRGDGAYVVVRSWSGAAWRTHVLRYSLAGRLLWSRALAPGVRVCDVTTDAADDLYLCGWSDTAAGAGAELASFSPDGTRRWTAGPLGDAAYTRATAVAAGGPGIVWAMDWADDAAAPGAGAVYASAAAPFSPLWGLPPGLTSPFELADVGVPADGGVMAVGTVGGQGAGSQGAVVRLDAAGAAGAPFYWSGDGTACTGDLVATDSGGAWLAGRSGATFSLLRFVPGAGLTWRHDFSARPAGRILALLATPDGGACAVGWSRATGAGADALVVRLDP